MLLSTFIRTYFCYISNLITVWVIFKVVLEKIEQLLLQRIRKQSIFLNSSLLGQFLNTEVILHVCFFKCSCGRCSKHHSGPNINVCISYGHQWCSHCPCSFSVSLPSADNFFCYKSNPFAKTYFSCRYKHLLILLFYLFCDYWRYLISLILLWRLNKQVDLLTPGVKDLRFGKFLKNGKGFYFLFFPSK